MVHRSTFYYLSSNCVQIPTTLIVKITLLLNFFSQCLICNHKTAFPTLFCLNLCDFPDFKSVIFRFSNNKKSVKTFRLDYCENYRIQFGFFVTDDLYLSHAGSSTVHWHFSYFFVEILKIKLEFNSETGRELERANNFTNSLR